MKPSHCLKTLCLDPPAPKTATSVAALTDPWIGQSTLHRTRQSAIAVREFEPGEFEWRADMAHSGCVLTGSAIIALADGREVRLHPGVTFYLPEGMHGHWMIERRLRTVVVQTISNDA